MIKRIFAHFRTRKHGQSLVELMLVTLILALILAGVVEYGFLLNDYLHVLDSAREAARYSNSSIAYDRDTGIPDYTFYYYTAEQAANTMYPSVKLDPTLGDDIIISVLEASGTSVVRHPAADGWSLCDNYEAFVDFYWQKDPNHPTDHLQSVPIALAGEGWFSCPAHASRFTDDDIENRLNSAAPNAGLLLVEILYNYAQVLKLPIFSNGEFLGVQFSFIPDPIPLYVYTLMPISSAEPEH